MDRRGIYLIVAFCVAIGIFFQINRVDGFLHLSTIRNHAEPGTAESMQPYQATHGQHDKFLVIYDQDDVGSMLNRHFAEKVMADQKKDYVEQVAGTPVDPNGGYAGILIITENPTAIPNLSDILAYAAKGGTVAIMERPLPAAVNQPLLDAMGVSSCSAPRTQGGLEVLTSFILGAKGFSMPAAPSYLTAPLTVTLKDSTTTHVTTGEGTPLLWENAYGQGKVIVYNSIVRDDKSNMGVYTAIISHCAPDSIYPVLGAKIFYIDDFPSPVPEGNFDRIYNELHVDTAAFYRTIWWPYMLENAEKYGLKYTGLIIETYGNQVKGPFNPLNGRETRDNIIIYGRELLAAGGELGLHGYNHMSLAPAGYNQDELGYTPWESEEDMVEAMQELRRYTEELYPNYEFRTYVPPSNILSPEGYRAVKKAFPEIKIYASLWDGAPEERCFYQEFGANGDGTYALPRSSAGHAPAMVTRWTQICAINYIGAFTHFVHPDEIFYEESANTTWAQMSTGLIAFMEDIFGRFPWLEGMTASEALDYLEDWLSVDYYVERAADHTTIYSWGTRNAPRFILRADRELDHAEGCTVTWIDDSAYLVVATDQAATIYWKETH